MKKKSLLVVAVIMASIFLCINSAFCQGKKNFKEGGKKTCPADVVKTCPSCRQMNDKCNKESADFADRQLLNLEWRMRIEKLKMIKAENPELYKKIMVAKRIHLMNTLQKIKNNNPLLYEKIMRRVQRAKLTYLKELKEKNPERFKQIVAKRKEALEKRLECLKIENPEKYALIKPRIDSLKEFVRLGQENPEKAREYLNQHPELKSFLAKRGFGKYGIQN